MKQTKAGDVHSSAKLVYGEINSYQKQVVGLAPLSVCTKYLFKMSIVMKCKNSYSYDKLSLISS